MRRAADTGALGVVLAGIALVVTAVILVVEWSGEPRERIVSVAQPSPLQTTPVVPIRPERTVCLRGVTLVPEGEVALVRVGTRRKPGVPLTATVAGPDGYRSQATVDGSWKDNDLLTFAFDPPPRAMHGSFCLRNDGRRTVDVYAALDAMTVARTEVDGREIKPNIQLAFRTSRPAPIRSYVGDMVDRVTVFRPGVVGSPVVLVLAVLTLLALVVGAPLALWRAVREPEPAAGSEGAERGAEPGLDLSRRSGPGPSGDQFASGGRAT